VRILCVFTSCFQDRLIAALSPRKRQRQCGTPPRVTIEMGNAAAARTIAPKVEAARAGESVRVTEMIPPETGTTAAGGTASTAPAHPGTGLPTILLKSTPGIHQGGGLMQALQHTSLPPKLMRVAPKGLPLPPLCPVWLLSCRPKQGQWHQRCHPTWQPRALGQDHPPLHMPGWGGWTPHSPAPSAPPNPPPRPQ